MRFTPLKVPLIGLLIVMQVGCAKPPPDPAHPSASLQRKMQQIEARVPSWVAAGGRHDDIAPFGAQLTWYLQVGQLDQAEAVADHILDIVSKKPKPVTVEPAAHLFRGLVTPAPNLPKNAVPGLRGFTDAVELSIESGGNVFGYSLDWDKLEPAPQRYNLQEYVRNPLILVASPYPQLKAVVVVFRMIDSNRRSMPADLQGKSFDDPEVLSRVDAVLDAIAAEPSAQRITYVLLGNEVDSYLSSHPEELSSFQTFYQRARERLHHRLPRVRVGTVLTFDVLNRPVIFDALAPLSDLIAYTFYPVVGSRLGDGVWHWQMRPISDVAADLQAMVQRVGSKPFAFTELGYSASALNDSSEDQQAAFVHEVFRFLNPYRKQGQLAFMFYHAMYDYSPDFCQPYARQQGIAGSAEFCAFVEHLGLRDYATGAPRKGWDAFVEEAGRWQHDHAP